MIGFCEVDTLVGLVLVVHIVFVVLENNIRVDSVVAVLRSKEERRCGLDSFEVLAVNIVHYRSVVRAGNSCSEVYHIRLLLGIVDSLRSPCTVALHHIRVLVRYLDNGVIEPVYEVGRFGGDEVTVAVPAEGGFHIGSEQVVETVLALKDVGISYALCACLGLPYGSAAVESAEVLSVKTHRVGEPFLFGSISEKICKQISNRRFLVPDRSIVVEVIASAEQKIAYEGNVLFVADTVSVEISPHSLRIIGRLTNAAADEYLIKDVHVAVEVDVSAQEPVFAGDWLYVEFLPLAVPVIPLVDICTVIVAYVVHIEGCVTGTLRGYPVGVVSSVEYEMLRGEIFILREEDVVAVG